MGTPDSSYPGLTTLLSCQANKNRPKIQAGPTSIHPDTRSRRGIKNTSAVKILSDPKVKISQTSQKVLIPLADQPFEKILEKNLLRLTPPSGGLKYACRARAGRMEPLIQPFQSSPLDTYKILASTSKSEVLFFYYGDFDKISLVDSGRFILELWRRKPLIFYHDYDGGSLRNLGDSTLFLELLSPKYPEVVNWFLFNPNLWSRKND
jgi:hypothetical protein